MDKNKQYEIALALLDFCESDLSTEFVSQFFQLHEPDLTMEQRNAVMLTALSLLKNG